MNGTRAWPEHLYPSNLGNEIMQDLLHKTTEDFMSKILYVFLGQYLITWAQLTGGKIGICSFPCAQKKNKTGLVNA